MRIFLAGATGVIGKRLVPLLVGAGHRVTAVARTDEKSAALSRQGATPVQVSLFDRDRLRAAVAGHDAVINLATSIPPASRALMPRAWRATARLRSIAAPDLIDAARAGQVLRVIQESFAPIYEDAGSRWIDESAPVRPARYNRAVMDAEHAATAFTGNGRSGIVLRFAFFYGPDSGFLQQTIAVVRRGWAPMFGSPDAFISSVAHDDAATAVVAALTLPPGIYNVTDDEPVTKREFYCTLADALLVPPPRFPPAWARHLTGSLGETLSRSQRLSNAKLRGSTGWSPRYPSVPAAWPEVVRNMASSA